MGILSGLAVGYEQIEPVIVSNVALDRNIILVGRHGTCKTTLARELAKGYEGSFVIYDATKDDIISICGIPKTKALEEGVFDFAIGERTIWDKKLIVIDEIGRATKENQNILLEILQEKTCFGKKLAYRTLIATMNPESYAASLRLDEALLDRFYCVINVPDFYKGAPKKSISDIVMMNLNQQRMTTTDGLVEAYAKVRNNYEELKRLAIDAVATYVSHLLEVLTGSGDRYISPRRYTMLADEILIIGAYYLYTEESKYLEKAARMALNYAIALPLKIELAKLYSLHNNFRQFLDIEGAKNTKVMQLRAEIARLRNDEEKTEFIIRNLKDIAEHLKQDEATNLMGLALEKCKDKERALLPDYFNALRTIADGVGFDDIKRSVTSEYRIAWDAGIQELIQKLGKMKLGSAEDSSYLEEINKYLQKIQTPDIFGSKEPEVMQFRKLIFQEKDKFLRISSIKELYSLIFQKDS
ncbi:MAG: AAA family ATPase [Nitrospirae bacterium]|nr:AAA family ATPase [Nitrospirota bacterium]